MFFSSFPILFMNQSLFMRGGYSGANKDSEKKLSKKEIKKIDEAKSKQKPCYYCKEKDMSNVSNKKIYNVLSVISGNYLYNYCKCGRFTKVEINYCPMCGRKLEEE